MPSSRIKTLLVKFVSKSATLEDLEHLELWIKDSKNLVLFKNFVKTQFAIQLSMNDPDSSEIRERLLKEIRNENKLFRHRKVVSFLKYASIAILFVGIGYFLKEDVFNKNRNVTIVTKEDVITLELENGDVQVLSNSGEINIFNTEGKIVGTQKGNRLVYQAKTSEDKISYNTLKVPYGKRFEIVLSDGTQVFLNSGSTLRYPVQFLGKDERQVFLKGEAFFDVNHDKKKSFSVVSEELAVKVLGTKFNMANYKEDTDTEVVLVDGSIRLEPLNSQQKVFLKPGFKGSFDKSNKSITAKKVNIALYTSWLRGQIVCRNTSFDNISKKLERHYNVTIINNNQELASETFNANIDVDNETIEQVLEYFNKIYGIDYKVVQNKIIIN